MSQTLTIICSVLWCGVGVVTTAVRLPGTWLIAIGGAAYGWSRGWPSGSAAWTLALVGAALIGEAVEVMMSVFTARRAGGSRQAAWGGMIGGIVGMLSLSFLVPVPIVGTMIGALVGCFAGATIVELAVRKRLAQGTRVGLFAAMGFALGTAAKVAVALVMSGLLVTSVILASTP